MKKKQAFFFLALLFIGATVFFFSFIQAWPGLWRQLPFHDFFQYQKKVSVEQGKIVRVKRVIDGDTIELLTGDKVRYIGVNAPESVDPRTAVECFGKEAAAFNKDLVEGKTVYLEKDISDHDKYGRLLRFVYLEDGTLVNEALIREGYASVMTYPPDVSKKDVFRAAEQQARDEERGLWNEKNCKGKK